MAWATFRPSFARIRMIVCHCHFHCADTNCCVHGNRKAKCLKQWTLNENSFILVGSAWQKNCTMPKCSERRAEQRNVRTIMHRYFRVKQTQQVKLHFYYLERMTCDIRGAVISPSFTILTAYCKVDDFLSRLVISIHSASDLMAGKFSATTTIIIGSRAFVRSHRLWLFQKCILHRLNEIHRSPSWFMKR